MSFLDTVARAKTYLREHSRVSLRALKLEFALDDEQLETLNEELVDIQQVAAREGRTLSWIAPAESPAEPDRAPRGYTPKHFADKILRSKFFCATASRSPIGTMPPRRGRTEALLGELR